MLLPFKHTQAVHQTCHTCCTREKHYPINSGCKLSNMSAMASTWRAWLIWVERATFGRIWVVVLEPVFKPVSARWKKISADRSLKVLSIKYRRCWSPSTTVYCGWSSHCQWLDHCVFFFTQGTLHSYLPSRMVAVWSFWTMKHAKHNGIWQGAWQVMSWKWITIGLSWFG